MARKPIPGGSKPVTSLLSVPTCHAIEMIRKARAEQAGKYVSQGEIVRELVEFGLKFKQPFEGFLKELLEGKK